MASRTLTPLRLTLGGGGTDLPAYYQRFGGGVLSSAIDKFVRVQAVPLNQGLGVILRGLKDEEVSCADRVEDELVRAALLHCGIETDIKIHASSDIPPGTGLGFSGSYLVGLLLALKTLRGEKTSSQEIAEEACHLEMEVLSKPVGKQDQYIAAFGGTSLFQIDCDGKVEVDDHAVAPDIIGGFSERLAMYYSGQQRSSSSVLADQSARVADDESVLESMHAIKRIGEQILKELKTENFDAVGQLFDAHWQEKKKVSGKMSDPFIDEIYAMAKENGALGGKIAGAGGGGYFVFYTEDADRLTQAMKGKGLQELPFSLGAEGAQVVNQSD